MTPVKRLRSILYDTATVISLLLCIGAALMWKRSRHAIDQVSAARNGFDRDGAVIRRVVGITSHPSRVEFNIGYIRAENFGAVIEGAQPGVHFSHAPINSNLFGTHRIVWRRFGVAYVVLPDGSNQVISVHYWAIVCALALIPGLWIVRRLRRRKRMAANTCPVCGYDMRATPQRCPECGTAGRAQALPPASSPL